MAEVYHLLQIHGFDQYILIDLGIIRNFDYYTGIVFEGYTQYIGSSICGGGRYDQLCLKFGKDIPSTGVAISIEKLVEVLEKKKKKKKRDVKGQTYFIRYGNKQLLVAIKLAQKLRKYGHIVEMELIEHRTRPEAIKYALTKEIRYFIDIQSDSLGQFKQTDLNTEEEKWVEYDSIKKQ
jgi:ATP phosphoribosyltransferase regulatory subunit